jgi:hypothetical protein
MLFYIRIRDSFEDELLQKMKMREEKSERNEEKFKKRTRSIEKWI